MRFDLWQNSRIWPAIKSNFIFLTGLLWLLLLLSALVVQVLAEWRTQERIFNDRSAAVAELLHQRLLQSAGALDSLETIVHVFDVIPFYGAEFSPPSRQASILHPHSASNPKADSEISSLFKSSKDELALIDPKMMPSVNLESGPVDAVLFNQLRGYIKEMMVHYPYISSVTLEPRVERDELLQFEARASSMLGMEYKIQRKQLPGENSGAAPSFYYPLTFKEPMGVGEVALLGMDQYADPVWRSAIDESVHRQTWAMTKPYSVNHERVFVLLKAVFSTASPSSDVQIRHTQAAHVLSMTINAQQLLKEDEWPASTMSLHIYNAHYPAIDPMGTMALFHAGSGGASVFFPQLHFSQHADNHLQPYIIETSRQLGWDLFRTTATIMSVCSSFGLALLLAAVISQRHKQQQLARETRDILFREKERALVTLHSINDAVLTVNAHGRIDYANSAAVAVLQQDMSAIKGCYINQVVQLQYDFSSGLTPDPIKLCLQEQRVIDFPETTVLMNESHGQKFIEGSISPLFDLEKHCIGAVVVFRDLGPVRSKALAALEASDKRLRQHQTELAHVTRLTTMGEMASGIAHEINQPLAAILSYNQACIRLLQQAQPDRDEIIRAMQAAALQSKRAGEIITRLRSFVTKKQSLVEPIQVNQHIHNVLTLSEHELRDHQISVHLKLAPALPLVAADGIQVEQVVLNLIRNAMDAMNEMEATDKLLTITSWLEPNRLLVSVRDNGAGLSEQIIDQLFHPFFTTKADGMGLGLTISTSIVESFGGLLSAHSVITGGAEFVFHFPLVAEHNPFIKDAHV